MESFLIYIIVFVVVVILVLGLSSRSPTSGGKKMKFLNHKLGYIGLVVVILAALGLGGVVNSMM